ncbi:MAG: RNA 2'-phosphotransferase [Ruminococcus sp.]|nr:RNA 2'-phosphotransferase [Ruminococcus sp.]
MDKKNTSIFISLILRHKPEVIGITLNQNGWADVDSLIDGINRSGKYSIDRQILDEIVRTDEKQRYSYSADGKKIRANQGHSVTVDVELEETAPPEYLWHGTAEKYVSMIEKEGLKPKSRLYVHLSADIGTARKVGTRHGKPVIYKILSGKMHRQGYRFFLSVNGVWLAKKVPLNFMEKV